MSVIKAKITGFKEVGSHIEYSISLSDVLNGKSFKFSHRYSVLRQVYLSLKPFSSSLSFPKKKFFGNRSEKFLNKRKNELEAFLTSVFAKQDLCKFLLSGSHFAIYSEEVEKKKTSQTEKVSICKDCIKQVSWNICNLTLDKFIDLSCHPGSLNESETMQVKETTDERCKDFKVEVQRSLVRIGACEEAGDKVGTKWVVKGFDECLDVLGKC